MAEQDALDRWRQYDWQLIAAEPTEPHMNLALDEVLTQQVGQGLRAADPAHLGLEPPVHRAGAFPVGAERGR